MAALKIASPSVLMHGFTSIRSTDGPFVRLYLGSEMFRNVTGQWITAMRWAAYGDARQAFVLALKRRLCLRSVGLWIGQLGSGHALIQDS